MPGVFTTTSQAARASSPPAPGGQDGRPPAPGAVVDEHGDDAHLVQPVAGWPRPRRPGPRRRRGGRRRSAQRNRRGAYRSGTWWGPSGTEQAGGVGQVAAAPVGGRARRRARPAAASRRGRAGAAASIAATRHSSTSPTHSNGLRRRTSADQRAEPSTSARVGQRLAAPEDHVELAAARNGARIRSMKQHLSQCAAPPVQAAGGIDVERPVAAAEDPQVAGAARPSAAPSTAR